MGYIFDIHWILKLCVDVYTEGYFLISVMYVYILNNSLSRKNNKFHEYLNNR